MALARLSRRLMHLQAHAGSVREEGLKVHLGAAWRDYQGTTEGQ